MIFSLEKCILRWVWCWTTGPKWQKHRIGTRVLQVRHESLPNERLGCRRLGCPWILSDFWSNKWDQSSAREVLLILEPCEPCTGLRKEAGKNDVWREHWSEGTLGISENFVIVQDLERQNNKKSSLRVLDVQQNRNISIFTLAVSWSFQMHLNGSGGTGPSASTRVAGVLALGKPSRANGFNEN